MLDRARRLLLPEQQRRTLEELTADLDLTRGEIGARSAFWTMLTLSAVIATAGVLSDSTATVIGAMIIAPLSTPIMGVALSIVKRERLRSVRYVAAGAALVVAIGAAATLVVPRTYDLLANSQIAGRTTPGLLDLVAAIATGLAGAVALARRDVAAVLPGVAIAISLVPPLAVVGICLGGGRVDLAIGALLLFASNLLALVLAGSLVFAALGYAAAAAERPTRRSRVALGLLLAAVALPLAGNTLAHYALALLTEQVRDEAEAWAEDQPGTTVRGVTHESATIVVDLQTESSLPDLDELRDRLADDVPEGLDVRVETTYGETVDLALG